MSLKKLEENYLNGKIEKSKYISKMYEENHDILFQYADCFGQK